MGRLTQSRVNRMQRPGRYADGGCLHLVVDPAGNRTWVVRVTIRRADGRPGRRVDRGLGSARDVSLSEARERASEARHDARRGIDPRPAVRDVPTLQQALDASAPAGMTAHTADMRRSALERYAGRLASRTLDSIGREDVLRVLTPIWAEKHNIASKLRGYLRAAFAWGMAYGHVDVNVADVIEGALPKVDATPKHHEAVPYEDVPNVLSMVQAAEDVSASVKACLAFIILTACRSGEAREATWSEVDFQKATWTIPASRTKTRRAHVVPLSDDALAILTARRGDPDDDGPIFPGRNRRKPISRGALGKALAKATDATVHGFRSSFRTWGENETGYDFHVLEGCLAHETKTSVQKAYARGDMLSKRRRVMNAWAEYATGATAAKVVKFAV